MAFPTYLAGSEGDAASVFISSCSQSGLQLKSLSPIAALQLAVANLLEADPTIVNVPAGDVSHGTFGANVPDTGTYTFPTAVSFGTILSSVTPFATPAAYVATTMSAFASTVNGAVLMGYGSTYDAALVNRAGTVVLGIGPNSTAATFAGAVNVENLSVSVQVSAPANSCFIVDYVLGGDNGRLLATNSAGAYTTAIEVVNPLKADAGITITTGGLAVTAGNVGIGNGPSANVGVSVTGAILSGSGSQFGYLSRPTFSAAATSGGTSYEGMCITAASAFTMSTAYVFLADSPSVGAGSAITTAAGLRVENQGVAGVTNAIGVDIAAQSGASGLNIGLRNAGSTVLSALGGGGGLVGVGAADSGGAGFRLLCVPN